MRTRGALLSTLDLSGRTQYRTLPGGWLARPIETMTYTTQKLQRSDAVKCRMVLRAVQQLTVEQPDRLMTMREIADRTPLSISAVWAALHALRDQYGYVAFVDGEPRTIRLTERY